MLATNTQLAPASTHTSTKNVFFPTFLLKI